MHRLIPVLLMLALAFSPKLAAAHAQLRASEPGDGAVLSAAPDRVVLHFNEPVAPLTLRWVGPDGTITEVTGVAATTRLSVTPPATLGRGTQRLSWRVLSDDGHPIGGTLSFHIGAPSAVPPEMIPGASGMGWPVVLLRVVLTVGVVVAVGAAVFAALVQRGVIGNGTRRLTALAVLSCFAAGIALVGVQGLDSLALPLSALVTAPPWRAGLDAPLSLTIAAALCAVSLAMLALEVKSRSLGAVLAAAAWAVAALSYAASGHSVTAEPRWLAASATALHAVALIYWMGALLPLCAALRQPDADRILHRFSTFAVPLVAVLLASGGALTWLNSGSVGALLTSTYGALLGAKLLLVMGLLALAMRNRMVLTPAFASGAAWAAPALSRAIRAEILLGLLILALASGFRLTPPPNAIGEPSPPLHAHFHSARASADIRLSPGTLGPNEIVIDLRNPDGTGLRPKEVGIYLAIPARGIEPMRLDAVPGDDALWRAGPVVLPIAGDWQMTLRLLVTDFDSVALQGALHVKR